jgi:hypothetical protein
MKQTIAKYTLAIVASYGLVSSVLADPPSTVETVKQTVSEAVTTVKQKTGEAVESVKQTAQELGHQAQIKAEKLAADIEQNQQAKELAAGILKPIYQLAEAMSFSAFHWLAFALMMAGVISWALQLVLAKLVVGTQGGFDIREIISDATVLVISLIGLVLTTQAATENSAFTQSTVSVLSSALAGLIFGVVLYFWGQSQELEAAQARDQQQSGKKRR